MLKKIRNRCCRYKFKNLKSNPPLVLLLGLSDMGIGFGGAGDGCLDLETRIEQKLLKSFWKIFLSPPLDSSEIKYVLENNYYWWKMFMIIVILRSYLISLQKKQHKILKQIYKWTTNCKGLHYISCSLRSK